MLRLQIILRHLGSACHYQKSLAQQSCLASSVSNVSPFITVEPMAALHDEDVHISLSNFPVQTKVTLLAHVDQLYNKMIFASCGHFFSDSEGNVDLHSAPSHGGTYLGVEPMGILWSLQAAPGYPMDTRMIINITDRPIVITLKTYIGHLSLDQIYNSSDEGGVGESSPCPVAQLDIERFSRAAGVRRCEVEEGSVRGTLFLPPGEGPFQGVIDMFGSSGGLTEYRAAMLASRGLAALSLAYFKYKDLPEHLYDLRYEYFEEAIDWLTRQPNVVGSGVGVIAVSKGVENALLMAAYSSKVAAVVCINGNCYPTLGNFLRENQIFLKARDVDLDKVVFTKEGLDLREVVTQPTDIFPIWQQKAKILFLESLDDFQTKRDAHKDLLAVCPEEKQSDIRVVQYEGAGHLLEPPYIPLCRSSINKGIGLKMKWGGQPRQHAMAQCDAWRKTLHFFRENIPAS